MKQMKFLAVLSLATLCLGFSSCDDDGNKETPSDIIGTWQRIHYVYDLSYPNHPERNESEDRDETESEAPFRRTINADGTFNEGFWKDGAYILGEGELYLGYWRLEGNKLDLSETKEFIKEEYEHYNIIELTESTMVLEVSELIEDEGNNPINYYEKATFKRIK